MKFYPKAAIDAAATFAGKEATRFVLNSVQFHSDGRLVATDGRRLLAYLPDGGAGTPFQRERVAAALKDAPNGKAGCLVDVRTLKSMTAKKGIMAFRSDGKNVRVASIPDGRFGEASTTTLPETEGVFPDVDEIIPDGAKEPVLVIGLGARLLGEALRALVPLAGSGETVRFTFYDRNSAVKMECSDGDGRTVAVIMPVLLELE